MREIDPPHVNETGVRNEGGGGGSGGLNPPITAQDPGICAFQGDTGWVP